MKEEFEDTKAKWRVNFRFTDVMKIVLLPLSNFKIEISLTYNSKSNRNHDTLVYTTMKIISASRKAIQNNKVIF
jgi:hypothetical protein